jgi:hypothetical protein
MFYIFQAAFKQRSERNSHAAIGPKKKKLNSSDNASGGSGLEATVPTSTGKRKRSPLPSSTQSPGTGTGTGSDAEHAPTTYGAPAYDHGPPASPPMPATGRSTGIAANQQTRLSLPVEEIGDQPLDHPLEKDPPKDDQVIAKVATILNPHVRANADAESVRQSVQVKSLRSVENPGQPKERELYTEEVDFLYNDAAEPVTSGEGLEGMLPSPAVEVPEGTASQPTTVIHPYIHTSTYNDESSQSNYDSQWCSHADGSQRIGSHGCK